MADESIIVREQGTIFLGGPPLVKAATGEIVTAEELGGADVHTRVSGVADHFAQDDHHALAIARRIVAQPEPREARGARRRARRSSRAIRPTRSTASSRPTSRKPYDVREVIARIVDGSELRRVQGALRHDARHRLRAHLGLSGRHRRATTACSISESAQKGAHFIELCCQRGIPLVFLQNITGFMVGQKYEAGGIAKRRREDGDRGRVRAACRSSP